MAIDRVGQKVVCVWTEWTWKAGCIALKQFPVKNQVYTVAGFDAATRTIPGVHLTELPGFACCCKGIVSVAWPLSAFRPVVERDTDISAFRHLLDTISEKVDA